MVLKLSMIYSKRIYFIYSFTVNSNPWFWFLFHSCFRLLQCFSLRKFQDKFFILHHFEVMYFILSRSMSVFCKRLWTKESLFTFRGFFYSDVLVVDICWLCQLLLGAMSNVTSDSFCLGKRRPSLFLQAEATETNILTSRKCVAYKL